jgi:hypothetical protein
MTETQLHRFLVIGGQVEWPYYAEVPFAAWPKPGLYYNSFGDCHVPCDRLWSVLKVDNRETNVTIVVQDAVLLVDTNASRRTRDLAYKFPTDSHEPIQGGQARPAASSPIPAKYCQPRYPLIFAQDPAGPRATAIVAELFLRRVAGSAVWDGLYDDLMDRDKLLARYGIGAELAKSIYLADDVRYWFGLAAGKLEDPRLHFWWKYPDQIEYALLQPAAGLASPPADVKGTAAWYWGAGYQSGYESFRLLYLSTRGGDDLEAYRTGYYAGQAQAQIDRGLANAG